MNERFESTRYALDDDALDGLLSGDIDPRSTDMDTNPVASFFAEVRNTTFADTPKPDPRLHEVFAAAPGARTGASPAVGRGVRTGANPAVGPGGRPASRPAVRPARRSGADQAVTPGARTAANPAVKPVGRPTAPGAEPTVVNWGGSVALDDTPASTRAGREPGFVPAPVGVYRPSPFEAVVDALRPTPSKALVAVSVLLVAFISAQILWFSDNPDDETQEIAGVDTSAESPAATGQAPSTAATAPTSVVESTDTTSATDTTPAQPTQAPAPTAATTTPTVAQIGPTSPTVATSATTTPTVPTSATSETVPSTPTSDVPASTASTDSTPPTSETPPSTEPVPTTPITPAPVLITIVPGQQVTVPAGTYRAAVENPAGCTVQVTSAEGNTSNHQAAAGTTIVFQVLDGGQVLTAAGCPTSFQLT